jgi:fibronectin type 3 domain-containing protein
MKKHLLMLFALLLGINSMNANPVDKEKAKNIGQKFACVKINNELNSNDLQLVYTGTSLRGETCFYVFNAGTTGFVIVSADDRFRPIVGYSNEGIFDTENMSPELAFYLDKIIEARTSRNAVLFDNTAQEWESVATTGKLISRNGGRGVDFICTTKWNQDSPYNLYAPEASSGPGGRCYAGCVATAMSQVMKYWNHPTHGTGSHSYYCYGYGSLSANFGATTYDWEHMPDRLGGASQEEIEAVALLMYHCGVSVDMNFSPTGSGANSWDVPYAIRHYFSYSNQCSLEGRDEHSLLAWQNMLKEQFDLGWPVYYSGFSESGGHAFVCDGYDDDDLFHFNWGWGGSSDGWFVIDEIDYAGWAQAIINYVPSDVYTYMPLQPENLSVESSNDFDYAATLSWTNPTQNIHLNNLTTIDQIVVTRNGKIVYTEDNVAPGANMSYTDHYIPTIVEYKVYAVVHNAKGLPAVESEVQLGPTCNWTVEMTSSDSQGWHDGALSFVNGAGDEVAHVTLDNSDATRTISLPFGHIDILWKKPAQAIDNLSFNIKNSAGESKVSFQGSVSDINNGMFFIANNTCGDKDDETDGPFNLKANLVGDHVTLTWDGIDIQNVMHYYIFRDNILIAVSDSPQYTDEQTTDAFHNYFVTAVFQNGETLHSNVDNVMQESLCTIPTNLHYEMVNPSKVKIMWDAPEADGVTGYYLYRRVKGEEFKRIKALTNTYYNDNLASQPNNRYEYAVTAYYRGEDCISGYATAMDNPEMHFVEVNKTIIPQHLGFYIHEGHVILQWSEATMAESYNVYRNGQLIGHSSGTDFVDYTATPQQSYHYTVTGCTAFIESNPSNMVYVDWTTNVNETNSAEYTLYPNPTEGQVTIEANGLRQIRVFNVTGQEIIHQILNDNHAIIDLSSEPKGCYFIEIMTENGCMTTKLIRL